MSRPCRRLIGSADLILFKLKSTTSRPTHIVHTEIMVKHTHTPRDYRAMCRQVRQLKKDLAQKDRKARRFRQSVLAAKNEYDKRLALEKQTSGILRDSMNKFNASLYKLKRDNKKLKRDNQALDAAARRSKRTVEHLHRGLQQLKALRKKKKPRKRSWAALEARLIDI